MISVQDISKSYGGLRAVDRVSFEIAAGELFGFLGPNGAGKTTTISILSGLLRPDEGTVTIGGYDLQEHRGRRRGCWTLCLRRLRFTKS